MLRDSLTLLLVPFGAFALFAPKRQALLTTVFVLLYFPEYPSSALGINLYPFRIFEVVLLFRVIARGEYREISPNRIDRSLAALALFTLLVFVCRRDGSPIYQLGIFVDTTLSYLAFRCLIVDERDFFWLLRGIAFAVIPLTLATIYEYRTNQSLFWSSSEIGEGAFFRKGRIRCMATFRHPSLLGTFAGTFLPLYVSVFSVDRRAAICGILACLLIVLATNSGGPISCVVVCIFGWATWFIRHKMRMLRWSIVLLLLALALTMKAPIWYVLERISEITGGDGYHRSYLLDIAFQNLDKWWLAGMPVSATAAWFPYQLEATGGADITNQFLSYAITAGAGAMCLFIAMVTRGFSAIGQRLQQTQFRLSPNTMLYWGLGVTLAVHVFNWLGISYFDQTMKLWLLQLAAIAKLTHPIRFSGTTSSIGISRG